MSFRYSTNMKTTTVTLASCQTALLAPAYRGRYYLAAQNTGLGAVTLRFSSSSITSGGGITLDPASTPGGQGGSWEWTDAIPINPIWAYSASGTTVVLLEANA